MADRKPWCWEASRSGQGPNWLFIAQVDAASEAALAQLTATAALPGYSLVESGPAYCEQHQAVCGRQVFIDTANARAYADNLRADKSQKNIWIYNTIEIHRGSIAIECGYGGRGEAYNEAESSFLLDLLASPEITLQSWSVMAGGDGYDYTTLRRGESLEQLKSYLLETARAGTAVPASCI
jgi:hypothetical protein